MPRESTDSVGAVHLLRRPCGNIMSLGIRVRKRLEYKKRKYYNDSGSEGNLLPEFFVGKKDDYGYDNQAAASPRK